MITNIGFSGLGATTVCPKPVTVLPFTKQVYEALGTPIRNCKPDSRFSSSVCPVPWEYVCEVGGRKNTARLLNSSAKRKWLAMQSGSVAVQKPTRLPPTAPRGTLTPYTGGDPAGTQPPIAPHPVVGDYTQSETDIIVQSAAKVPEPPPPQAQPVLVGPYIQPPVEQGPVFTTPATPTQAGEGGGTPLPPGTVPDVTVPGYQNGAQDAMIPGGIVSTFENLFTDDGMDPTTMALIGIAVLAGGYMLFKGR